MKRVQLIAYSCLLAILGCSGPTAAGESTTLAVGEMSGIWRSDPRISSIRGTLNIHDDHSSDLTLNWEDGTEVVHAGPDSVSSVAGHLLIIEFEKNQHDVIRKLVLAGHKVGETHTLFGTMYLYSEDGLFNGIPMTFERSLDPTI